MTYQGFPWGSKTKSRHWLVQMAAIWADQPPRGIVICTDGLDTVQHQTWLRHLYRFRPADTALIVSPHLMARLQREELRPLREKW